MPLVAVAMMAGGEDGDESASDCRDVAWKTGGRNKAAQTLDLV